MACSTCHTLTCGSQSSGISGNVVCKYDGPHAGLARPTLAHQQDLEGGGTNYHHTIATGQVLNLPSSSFLISFSLGSLCITYY